MTGRRHRSNCELVAQGFANIASALFGGICVTGTIARTATNVRAGAHGPVSGMLHAAVPAGLHAGGGAAGQLHPARRPCRRAGGGLPGTCSRSSAFATLLRASRGDALVLLATFLIVVFRDLTEGIVVGFALGSILFIDRMAKSIAVEADAAAGAGRCRRQQQARAYDASEASDTDTVVYRISGAFFFGAASTVGTRARPHRRPAQEFHPRLFRRAASSIRRPPMSSKAPPTRPARRRALHHSRRLAADTAHADQPRRQAPAGDLRRVDQGRAGAAGGGAGACGHAIAAWRLGYQPRISSACAFTRSAMLSKRKSTARYVARVHRGAEALIRMPAIDPARCQAEALAGA